MERDRYIPIVARRTGYSLDAIRAQCQIGQGPVQNNPGKYRHTKQNQGPKPQPATAGLETTLLACMLKSQDALLAALSRMQALEIRFPTAALNQLAERLLAENPDPVVRPWNGSGLGLREHIGPYGHTGSHGRTERSLYG